MNRTVAVVTSMGRRAHLERSLPLLLRHTPLDVVVVDYSCPDGSGDWAKQFLRVHVVWLRGRVLFNKPRAQHLGAGAAVARGATHLLFVDADTLVGERLWAEVQERAAEADAVVFRPSQATVDLTGFMHVRLSSFVACGGFDEHMDGWGSEELDLRCRLWATGCKFAFIEDPFATAIQHEDELRVRFYREQNRSLSNLVNMERMLDNYERLCGRDLTEDVKHHPELARLIGPI